MNVSKLLIISISLLTLFNSCKDIVAKNISGKTPVLIFPTTNDTLKTSPVTFKWEQMEGATKYHLQIASPSFTNIKAYILDTLVTTTLFKYNLDSNQYEFKLTAQNAGYTSQILGPIKFWVGVKSTTGNVATLTLTTPTADSYVNKNFDGKFAWSQVTNATNYEFELRKGDGFYNTSNSIYSMQPGNTLDKTLPNNLLPLEPGVYSWRVAANNATGQITQKLGRFYVDTLTPPVAVLSTPTDNSNFNVSDTATFAWSISSQNASYQSSITSLIEVSDSQSFTSIIFSYTSNSTNYKKALNSFTSGKTYYWRVSTKDAAGNNANSSLIYKFSIY